jgi:hypothetical protein
LARQIGVGKQGKTAGSTHALVAMLAANSHRARINIFAQDIVVSTFVV